MIQFYPHLLMYRSPLYQKLKERETIDVIESNMTQEEMLEYLMTRTMNKKKIYTGWNSFLGGCLQAEEAGTLGDAPDASKRHQGPGGPYTGHSRECLDDMPQGTTKCPRCSRPGDLLKQQGGKSTLGFRPGGAGGWCGVGSGGHGERGVWRLIYC